MGILGSKLNPRVIPVTQRANNINTYWHDDIVMTGIFIFRWRGIIFRQFEWSFQIWLQVFMALWFKWALEKLFFCLFFSSSYQILYISQKHNKKFICRYENNTIRLYGNKSNTLIVCDTVFKKRLFLGIRGIQIRENERKFEKSYFNFDSTPNLPNRTVFRTIKLIWIIWLQNGH